MNNLGEPCVLEDRVCTQCGECDLCDLDPTKRCDNCCQCIKIPEGDFAEIEIEDILVNTEDKTNNNQKQKGHSNTYKLKQMRGVTKV